MRGKRTAASGVKKAAARSNKRASSSAALKKAASKNMVDVAATPSGAGTEQKTDAHPVYFWKPDQGNGFLGQWYPSPFVHEGETYATAEMWMMVQKARLFGDEAVAKEMLATTDPKQHKALGRRVSPFSQEAWDEHRLRIVTEGNVHKFTISEDAAALCGQLLATGERELVEASPMDRVWGIGYGEKKAGLNRHRWGKNLLGKALMDVREQLRKEEVKKKE